MDGYITLHVSMVERQFSAGLTRCTAKFTQHIPPGQFGRYLLVGLWNTLFGYGTFALLTALLNSIVPHSYILASLLSSVLNITVAYFGYKWFVFKTKGNYLREWIRCVIVYSGGIGFSLIALPVLVLVIRRNTRFVAGAPYIAGAILMAVVVVYSFLGHRKFSFRSPA
jgi:putative flippase GtrA